MTGIVLSLVMSVHGMYGSHPCFPALDEARVVYALGKQECPPLCAMRYEHIYIFSQESLLCVGMAAHMPQMTEQERLWAQQYAVFNGMQSAEIYRRIFMRCRDAECHNRRSEPKNPPTHWKDLEWPEKKNNTESEYKSEEKK